MWTESSAAALPPLGLVHQRREGDRRLEQSVKRRLARLKRPPAEPPHCRSLCVVRLLRGDQERYLERGREVDGAKLSGGRLDEWQVAASKGVAKTTCSRGPWSTWRTHVRISLRSVHLGVGDANPGIPGSMATALSCKTCGTRWFARAPERLLEVGELCLVCDGELEPAVEATTPEEKEAG